MTALLALVLVLAQACPKAAPLAEGAAAPCTGILWPVEKTRAAVACLKVDLPDCQRQAELAATVCGARLAGCVEGRDAWKAAKVRPCPPPAKASTPWGLLSLVGGGALVVGFLGGALTAVLARD